MLSTLLEFVSFGLVTAATIIIFSIASFSFLYTSEEMPRGSGIRDQGVEVEPVISGGFPYIYANRPTVPAEIELPGSAAEATVSTSPDSPAAHDMRPLDVGEAQSVSEPLSPSASEGSATQDALLNGTAQTRAPEVSGTQLASEPLSASASEGTATQDALLNGTAQTRAPEVIGARPVPAPLPPGASEENATQGASLSGIVPTLPIPAAQRDRVSHEFTMHHNQRANFGTSPGAVLSQPAPATSQRATPSPGGAGQVWVNTTSKVYHCPGTRWYGKTQQGSFMSEAQAQAQGARPDHRTLAPPNIAAERRSVFLNGAYPTCRSPI